MRREVDRSCCGTYRHIARTCYKIWGDGENQAQNFSFTVDAFYRKEGSKEIESITIMRPKLDMLSKNNSRHAGNVFADLLCSVMLLPCDSRITMLFMAFLFRS